jgi:enterochelin esterase-like enzyme
MTGLMRILIPLLGLAALLEAQGPPPRLISPEVTSDNRVTFRFRAPNAKAVTLNREGVKPVDMQKDDQGVWSLTTEPLEPDYYGYSFNVDGVGIIDPVNSLMKPNLLGTTSMVHVPGAAPLPWEDADVPRGMVHHHFYKSTIVGDNRDFYVYTPAGYDAKAKGPYPVLYLFHGYSDDASGWTAVGRAHVILDNLIAQGKVKPMLIVMPLGYGAPEIVSPRTANFRDEGLRKRNFDRFRDALFEEVMPQVERSYNASKDRSQRAIAGLSMGGAEALLTGLNALDRFAWVGAFSAGGAPDDFEKTYPGLDSKANDKLRLLWIACGKDDFLFQANNKFDQTLTERGIKHSYIVSSGGHTWMNWRRYLADFTPLLFKD